MWQLHVRRMTLTIAVWMALVGAAVAVGPIAHANADPCPSTDMPCIEFLGPLYRTTQVPEGVPGTRVHIKGMRFDSFNGQSLALAMVPGNTVFYDPSAPSESILFCRDATVKAFVKDPVTVTGGGFDTTVVWPTDAVGQGDVWTICAYDSSSRSPAGNLSSQPGFQVLSQDPLSISVAPSSLQGSGTITVTGRSWLPEQNVITVRVSSCPTCSDTLIPDTTATSGLDGTFSVQLSIPASVAAGSYAVTAFTPDHSLDVAPDGLQTLTILSPTPTATTALPSSNAGGQTGTSGGTSAGATTLSTGQMLGGAATIVVLLLLTGVLFVQIRNRRRRRLLAALSSPEDAERAALLGNRKVFISHAHEDTDRCAPLLAALSNWGVDYWFDTQRMDAGSDLSERIQRAIGERDIFLRICTPAAQASYWVKLETGAYRGLQAAEHKTGRPGKRLLINLILDARYVHEPFDFAQIFLDAANRPQQAWLGELRKALGADSTSSAKAPAATPDRPGEGRRR